MTTKSRPVRIGLIGAGGISRAHTKAFPLHPTLMQLVSVTDVNATAARRLAEECGQSVQVRKDHRELLQADAPDAVIVTLPHYLHHPVGLECLRAGVAVLVEKPITCSASELRELDAVACSKGVVLMAGQMRRFNTAVGAVRDWAVSHPQNFGELRSFELTVQVNVDAYTGGKPGHWILDGTLAGGGVIASFGIHRLDLVRLLGGADFSEVCAVGRFDEPFCNGAESAASVLIRMDNGATGTVHANGRAPRTPYMDSFILHGSHGSIMEVGGPLRYASTRGAVTNQWGHQHEGWVDVRESVRNEDDAFVRQLEEFARAVQEGGSPRENTAARNFNTIACLDAIRASLGAGGKPVAVERW